MGKYDNTIRFSKKRNVYTTKAKVIIALLIIFLLLIASFAVIKIFGFDKKNITLKHPDGTLFKTVQVIFGKNYSFDIPKKYSKYFIGYYDKKYGGAKTKIKGKSFFLTDKTFFAHYKTYGVDIKERGMLLAKLGDSLKLTTELLPPNNKQKIIYESSNENVATVSKDGNVTAVNFGDCYVTARVGLFSDTAKISVKNKWVALTFDDGPGPRTNDLLDALEKADARATFFLLGQCVKNYNEEVRREQLLGCEIANHSYSHPYSYPYDGFLKKQLDDTDKEIMKAIGTKSSVMRPPGGIIKPQTKRCGKPVIMWSLDTLDWKNRDTNYVYNYVLNNVSSGDIVLMHDIHSTTVDAAIKLFSKLQDEGYFLATVSEICGGKLKNGKRYNTGSEKPRAMRYY